MAMDIWATFEDVQTAYEKALSDDQSKWVEYQIGRASRRLNVLAPGIQARIDDGSLDPADVKDVIIGAVLRIVRNPDGYSMEMEGNYSTQIRADVAGGALMFTADDLNQVRARPQGELGGGPYWSRVLPSRRRP